MSLFSGGAKGVDQISMTGAIEAGGTVVGILADALERRLKDPETRRLVSDERVCLASPWRTCTPTTSNASSPSARRLSE